MSEQTIIPLYGVVQGDSTAVTYFTQPDVSVNELAQRIVNEVKHRVAVPEDYRVLYQGAEVTQRDQTLTDAGFEAYQRVDIAYA